MKTLNIELNVRRMEAQNILTTSSIPVNDNPVSGSQENPQPAGAAARGGNAGSVPVRAGF